MTASSELLVDVKGLVPTPSGTGVFLHRDGKSIAIFVDGFVGAAIGMSLQGIRKPRPLTHDLIGHIFNGLGVTVQKVVVNDLQNETFYARIHLTQENELGRNVLEIDARPSDSIAIAIQQGCPIYVAESVWDAAEDMTWALRESTSNEGGAKEDEEEDDLDMEELEKLLFGDEGAPDEDDDEDIDEDVNLEFLDDLLDFEDDGDDDPDTETRSPEF